MLKIYLCTTEFYLRDKDYKTYLHTDTRYVIRDESVAVNKTKEWNAYTKEAKDAYDSSCNLLEKRKGIKALYWTWEGPVYAREWIAPDAKLVANISYKEKSCSAGHLLKLPATDVIAYLKQEGMNLVMPS